MKKLLLIVVAAGAALFGPGLRADNYPSKSITLVAVFGPGSASDTICRVIAQPLLRIGPQHPDHGQVPLLRPRRKRPRRRRAAE